MGFGDDLMLTGQARVAQVADPRKVRPMLKGRPWWSVVYENNPRFARPGEAGDFQQIHGRDALNNRPYHLGKSPQRWVYNLAFRPTVGELYLTDEEHAFAAKYAGRVVLEPNLKPGASPNKQWGWGKWQALANRLKHLPLAQMGPPGAQRLQGVEFIDTAGFRQACAVIKSARACVLPEGGLHHAAAALSRPAVVIFGGFTPVELTGYAGHVNLGASLKGACGERVPCDHCARAMAAITVDAVIEHLKGLL